MHRPRTVYGEGQGPSPTGKRGTAPRVVGSLSCGEGVPHPARLKEKGSAMSLFGTLPTTDLSVTGMHCEKCVARVKDALEAIDGVTAAEVSLDSNSAKVTGDVDAAAMIAAIEALGFGASIA